jgi:hypothetical protein
MRAGKYSMQNLPKGPRGQLFRSLLPGIQPLLAALDAVAASRKKTCSQVPPGPSAHRIACLLALSPPRACCAPAPTCAASCGATRGRL